MTTKELVDLLERLKEDYHVYQSDVERLDEITKRLEELEELKKTIKTWKHPDASHS